jgi:2-dehydro-3-deoxyphosphogluconate aldolase / (4S)-4-hydroxy-2-oxoglutarate aldolase
MDASELLSGVRVVPVVVIDDSDNAVPLAECFVEAGLTTIEVTLRTDTALDSIERIASNVPGIVVGAGSLRSAQQVLDVSTAGARFAVAPGATDTLIEAAQNAKLPLIPGAATASEMMRLLEYGYLLQKFFPAELAGGIPYLDAVGAPLPEVRFVPTGGIDAELAVDYLALKNVAAVGGSWIAPSSMIVAKNFEAIARLAADAAGQS